MEDYSNLPKSRKEAKSQKSIRYFTGKPCKNGHIDSRLTCDGACKECNRLKCEKQHNLLSKEEKTLQYKKHRPKQLIWNKNNQDRIKEIRLKWEENNKDKIKQYKTTYNKRIRQNPLIRLNQNIGHIIWSWLKGNKGYKHWQEFVDFSIEELKVHLENQFRDGMTWENYGSFWELDHIKPISKCSSFEEAWKLLNLQPLTTFENQSKNNRYIGSPNNRIEVDS